MIFQMREREKGRWDIGIVRTMCWASKAIYPQKVYVVWTTVVKLFQAETQVIRRSLGSGTVFNNKHRLSTNRQILLTRGGRGLNRIYTIGLSLQIPGSPVGVGGEGRSCCSQVAKLAGPASLWCGLHSCRLSSSICLGFFAVIGGRLAMSYDLSPSCSLL